MLVSFLLSVREGLEAALIIGIVLGVLYKLKRVDLNKFVWFGATVAAALSVVTAVILDLLGMEFEGTAEQIFDDLLTKMTEYLAVAHIAAVRFTRFLRARCANLDNDSWMLGVCVYHEGFEFG